LSIVDYVAIYCT